MTDFDWTSALIGGALIGLSATLLMLLLGRIAGVSGILAGCLDGVRGEGASRDAAPDAARDVTRDVSWRAAFILGLVAVPLIGKATGLFTVLPPQMPASWSLIAVAGLLVGFGTRMGGGCTSGHGVCGVARLSPRSLTATAIFVATAAAVVAVTRHVIGG
jgi:uncharacterized membrane protein YedE/YeeE